MKRAATIASSLEAEQDSGNINRTQSMATLNESFPQGTDSATDKVQTVNEEVKIQALIDGKKVIIIETSVRRALYLKDAKGTDCLPTATIFAELERMGYENLTQKLTFYKAFFSPQWEFLIHTILQCLIAKTAAWNEFSSIMASAIICLATNKIFNFSKYIFDNMVKNLEALEEVGEGSAVPIDSHYTITQPSTSRPQKKQSRRKQRKDSGPTEPITDEANNEEHVVLALKNTNTSQAAEIATLKERVMKLEKKRRSRTYKPRRLYKVGFSRRIESSDDASLGVQEDASKQGRKIADLDADIEVTLIDETQWRNDEDLMFDTGVLNGNEVFQEPMVNIDTTTSLIPISDADPVTTADEVVTTASVEIPEELTLAQTLIEIKSAKPKAFTTIATTVTPASSRPKAKGIVFHDQEEQAPASTPIVFSSQPSQAKDKGKTKMVEPEKPLKKKDQIAFDEEVARNLEAQLQAELEEEERLSRQKEEESNIALIESWDKTQAMMDADFQLAQQMQTEEQEQLSIEEKSKSFVELLEKRKKHFATLRAKEKRNKPPTKTQNINTMSTYLKNMTGYKHNQLKSKKFVKGSKTKAEGSSKRAREELESDNSKKQKIDEHVEVEGDDDQEEAEMKKHMDININREDLETLWKLVKAKHRNTRPEEAYERVL
ncbi:hypothetical protein Tco_0400885 [Tanacetum coccineum]